MRALKIVAVIAVALLVAVIFLPELVPGARSLAWVEARATKALGEPVHVGALRLALLPRPQVELAEVAVGPARELAIARVRLEPRLRALLERRVVFSRVEVEGFDLDAALLARLDALRARRGGPASVEIERLALRAVHLVTPAFRWGPLRAEVAFARGQVQTVEAGSEDGRLSIALQPAADGHFRLDLAAEAWRPPVAPAMTFETLHGHGRLSEAMLDLSEVDGRLYGGYFEGRARAGWTNGVAVDGALDVRAVDVAPLARLAGSALAMRGRLDVAGDFAARAPRAVDLRDGLRANLHFTVRPGAIANLDLATAVRTLAREGTRGGETRFDELSGRVELVGRRIVLRDLRVASGLLRAGGEMEVSPSKKLSGRIRVEMKGTAGLVAVPLEVAGTLDDPVLFPSRAALAGAAVGTGLLGAGWGTGLGAKAGERLERLFR